MILSLVNIIDNIVPKEPHKIKPIIKFEILLKKVKFNK